MVERSLSMREAPGSIPGASIHFGFVGFPIYTFNSKKKIIFKLEERVIFNQGATPGSFFVLNSEVSRGFNHRARSVPVSRSALRREKVTTGFSCVMQNSSSYLLCGMGKRIPLT